MDLTPFLFHGDDPFSARKRDVLHEEPVDHRTTHIWVKEPVTSGVLTRDGVEHIANHKYTPGAYTHLDIFLNPTWTALTELVPLWLAPNMMTTIAGMHGVASYALTWYHSENNDTLVPSWVCAFNGYCLCVCYTLDCMDGKQARRTGTSSPLGQLFDHGFDCLNNLAHLSSVAACMSNGSSYFYFLAQSALQFSFFCAQWEEYYTEVLPHAMGDWIGVTEVAYGISLFSLVNAFLDREAVWTTPLYHWIPAFLSSDYVPRWLELLEMRQFALSLWGILIVGLVHFSILRVTAHVQTPNVYWSAYSKLLSPFLLAISPFILSAEVVQTSARYLSLSMGLVFCIITTKLIFFAMAKMAYASLQLEVTPFLGVCLWSALDERLTPLGSKALFQLLCVWYGYRLLEWAHVAIRQLCARLDIYCFTIKKKEKKVLTKME